MFSVLVIRLRSLRLLRVSGIVMRLRMFLLLITFLKASHSFRNRLLVICKNAYLFATMIMTSVSSPFSRSEERFRRNAEIYPLYLHDALPIYHLLEGFPFIQEPPSGDLQERVLIRHHDYDQCFQSVQLLQWNSQVKFNVTVYRNLPTTRDSIMTS